MGEYLYLGIDLGTTVLKAAVFKKNGTCLAEAAEKLPIVTGAGGKREQDASRLPAIFVKTAREALAASGKNAAAKVSGIGIAAQGGSFVMADAKSGKTQSAMVLWNDMRGQEKLAAIAKKKPLSFWHPMSYVDGPVVGVAKLAHHAKLHPHWFAKETICAGAGAFLFHQLTGEWRQEAGHAIQLGCYNWKADKLDLRGLAAAGLNIAMPPMRPGDSASPLSAQAAKSLGLKAGIPVAGPYMDHEAGYRALRGVGKRPMQVSLGTAWVANAVLPAKAPRALPLQIFMPALDAKGRFCVHPIKAGNQTWDWALHTFLGGSGKEEIKLANQLLDQQTFPAAGLVALPFIYAANPLDPALLGGVSFIGAGFDTSKEDFLRAVVTGLCYEFKYAMGLAYPGKTCDAMILCGGTSRSPAIQRLIAGLFAEHNVYLNPQSDIAGPLGAVAAFGVRGLDKLKKLNAPPRNFVATASAGYKRYLAARARLG